MKFSGVTRREFIGGSAAAVSVALLPRLGLARVILGGGAEGKSAQDDMDRDLLEVTIPKLRAFYESKKYTTTQVTRWYLSRIARYDRVYRSMIHVDSAGALATAAAQDAAAAKSGAQLKRGLLWGVPIVIKANTSVKGLVTSAGWIPVRAQHEGDDIRHELYVIDADGIRRHCRFDTLLKIAQREAIPVS